MIDYKTLINAAVEMLRFTSELDIALKSKLYYEFSPQAYAELNMCLLDSDYNEYLGIAAVAPNAQLHVIFGIPIKVAEKAETDLALKIGLLPLTDDPFVVGYLDGDKVKRTDTREILKWLFRR